MGLGRSVLGQHGMALHSRERSLSEMRDHEKRSIPASSAFHSGSLIASACFLHPSLVGTLTHKENGGSDNDVRLYDA